MSGSFAVTYQGTYDYAICNNMEEAENTNVQLNEQKIITHWPSWNIAITFGKNFANQMQKLAKNKSKITDPCSYYVLYQPGCSIKDMTVYQKQEILDCFEKGINIQGKICQKFDNYETAVLFIVAVNDTYAWMIQQEYSIADDWTPKAFWNNKNNWTSCDSENDYDPKYSSHEDSSDEE